MKNISHLVNANLVRSIENHDKLSAAVYSLLHLNKEKHNVWVVVKQNQLTIMTDNPYLGTQLQYQQQNICDHLNQQFLLQLRSTKVRIIPPSTKASPKQGENFMISNKAGKILATIAEDIEDEALKESLLALSKKTTP